MTTKEHLIEQHIREYESRLKHIDELYERAHKATEHLDDEHETRSELKTFAKERSQLPKDADEIKTMPIENWREETVQNAGPMAIWDILAQKLEDFLERHE
jgi:3'-phosphoadenosine 5'-phosphosulfate sulfotransferase (PAPS reductase)/FAD synthetase